MEKAFDAWNTEKKMIHQQELPPFCYPREVWWCALGVNVGDEQDGTGKNFDRPIVVVRGFNERIFLGIALTGKKKVGDYYFYLGKIADRDASAVLSQMRLIDSKRLVKKIAVLDKITFENLQEALKKMLFG
ncbi:MAG: type II toxin-antitoxin system PemK/MazF family toxin [Candidatus Sungbacteria bacterium]|nr:type II toxin-antitoxin system PemK/MazF family toxin [Candidatus Sungbacteria bacterium]